MWLEELSIHHFRNYENTTVQFQSGLTIFLGQNAQGKTNLLESIYFLALTRSHRTRLDRELIQFSAQSMAVHGLIHKATGKLPLDIELTQKGRITKVNHLKQERLSDYIGHLNIVLFAPEDLQLIKGSPSIRRKFLDIELAQIKPTYLSDLSQYNHVLKQRNAYLKSTNTIDDTFLAVLDEQLAEYGSKVMQHRLEFLKQLEYFSQKKHLEISNQSEHLTLAYRSSIALTKTHNIIDTFLTGLSRCHTIDKLKRTTTIGPHRDDISFFINEIDARYGSQGQHRSLVLSLKLAELELMNERTGEYPILLLDDVMSELDNGRQIKLLDTISDTIQTFITTTTLDHLPALPEKLQIFCVENGNIRPVEVDNSVNKNS